MAGGTVLQVGNSARLSLIRKLAVFSQGHRRLSLAAPAIASFGTAGLGGLAYHLLTMAPTLTGIGTSLAVSAFLGLIASRGVSLRVELDRARSIIDLAQASGGLNTRLDEIRKDLEKKQREAVGFEHEISKLREDISKAPATEKVDLSTKLNAKTQEHKSLLGNIAVLECSLVRQGKFEKVRELGRGGMGKVLLYKSHGLGKFVVVKKGLLEGVAEWEKEQRIKRHEAEAVTQAEILHSNVARVYALMEVDGDLAIVQEFVEGKTLGAILKQKRKFSVDEAINYALQIAEGLKAAHEHEKSIMHRDLKPDNVMVADLGNIAKIIDFGLARSIEIPRDERLTIDGTTFGTPEYMSPEQAEADKNIGTPTDIFALGCMLYEFSTGQVPFADTMQKDAGQQQLFIAYYVKRKQEKPPKISNLPDNHPLQELVAKMLSANPSDRPPIRDVIKELKKIQTPST